MEPEALALTLPIRRLVEFLLRTGSIDSRFTGFDRALEGARLHRKLQLAAQNTPAVFFRFLAHPVRRRMQAYRRAQNTCQHCCAYAAAAIFQNFIKNCHLPKHKLP